MKHTYIQTNGIRLHVVQAGPENGPLVILLHGFPEFWYGWSKQIQPLVDAGFRVWVPDQRGYNLSDKPEKVARYRVDEMAKDVVGLLDAAGVEKCLLAGHDWGAAVAWETAIRYPERIERLAILNVPHLDVMQRHLTSSFAQLRKSWYIFFFQLPWIPERVLSQDHHRNLARMLVGSGKKGTFRREDIEQYKAAWAQPGAVKGMIAWYRAMFRSGFGALFSLRRQPPRQVRVPTLILWGKNDIALDSAMVQPSLALCDQGRLVFYETATHWVQHDEAEAVSQELVGFF